MDYADIIVSVWYVIEGGLGCAEGVVGWEDDDVGM